jgi:hypothetical protein
MTQKRSWKEVLSDLRDSFPTELDEAADDVPALQQLAQQVEALLTQVELEKGRLMKLKGQKGKIGESADTALRMTMGFTGTLTKFKKMLDLITKEKRD